MRLHILIATVITLSSSLLFAETAKTLKTGEYTAQVKSITCGGCAGLIEETLTKTPGLEKVAVNTEKKTVSFTVKKGAIIPVADLQKTLKAASDQMGMGADYRLDNIQTSKKG